MIKALMFGAAALLMATPAFACDDASGTNTRITVCTDNTWVAQPVQGAADHMFFSDDNTYGFMMITEKVNASVADFRQAILTNAAGSGAEPKILGERIENVGGKPWNVIEFQTAPEGTTLNYTDFYYVAPGYGAVQLIFWTTPDFATGAAFRAGQLLATAAME